MTDITSQMEKEIKIALGVQHADTSWSVRVRIGSTLLWGYGLTAEEAIADVQELADSHFGNKFKIILQSITTR